MKSILLLFFISIQVIIFGQTQKHFPYLKRTSPINNDYILFAYDENHVQLINKPLSTNRENDYIVMGMVSPEKDGNEFTILFTEGESGDPTFYIRNKKKEDIFSINATELYITGNNIIYTAGHTNNMFDKRRKFTVTSSGVKEEKQPYYYVGLKGKTQTPVKLFKDLSAKEVIAVLPVNYEIEILLCDTDEQSEDRFYLVKTEFGLVGWMILENSYLYETPLEKLRYAGD